MSVSSATRPLLLLLLVSSVLTSVDNSRGTSNLYIIDLLANLHAEPASSIVSQLQPRDAAFLQLNSTGYFFSGMSRKVQANASVSNALTDAMQTHSVYTFVVTLQARKSAGALLTLSKNANRVLEVYYQYRNHLQVRLIYQRPRGDLKTLTFSAEIPKNNGSIELVLTVTAATVEFMVNCENPQQVALDEPVSVSRTSGDKMVLWVAQRNPASGLFTGTINRMLFIANRIQSPWFFPSCSLKELGTQPSQTRSPSSSESTLTVESVQRMIEAAQTSLQARVLDLECRLRDAESQLAKAESQLFKLQSCEQLHRADCHLLKQVSTTVHANSSESQTEQCTQCSCQPDVRTGVLARQCRSIQCSQIPVLQCPALNRSTLFPPSQLLANQSGSNGCELNGTVYSQGSSWRSACQTCSCQNGVAHCSPLNCPPINCSFALVSPGECCPKCFRTCSVDERVYEHGETVPSSNDCESCTCDDGERRCTSIASCPTLNCSEEERYIPSGSCCPACLDRERCVEACGSHFGNCTILQDGAVRCSCEKGYEMVSGKCTDIDECKRLRRVCPKDSRCRNTEGSYTCLCRNPGFALNANKTACVDIDECELGTHRCPATAVCNNTVGTYQCSCKPGYVDVGRNGHNCQPECNPACQNGGVCVRPNVCQCPFGFRGPLCDQDIDECSWDLHACTNSSFCVNLPGTYYCNCMEPAYHLPPSFTDSKFGQNCVDVDECEITSLNTCPEESGCVNTIGGYYCACNKGAPNCSLNCLLLGEIYDNGEVFKNPDASKSCEQCECRDGRVSCTKQICNCNEPSSLTDTCCQHCRDVNTPCIGNGSKVHQHGDKWTNACTQYQCDSGRIYARDVHCPDVQCRLGTVAVRRNGHCCSICEEQDVCAGTADLALFNSNSSCKVGTSAYEHGQRWSTSSPHCLSCECKYGHICCTQDPTCAE